MDPKGEMVRKLEASRHAHKGFFRKLIGDIDDYAKETPDFDASGISFIVHMTSMYWGIRGLGEALIDAAANPFFIMLGASSQVGGDFTSRIWLPYSMKPIYAILSDIMPVGRYKKRWYFVGLSVVGTLACLALSLGSHEQLGGEGAEGAFYLFFICIMCGAMGDTLTQGKYSEVAKAKGSGVVTYNMGSKVCAGIIGYFAAGFVNDMVSPQITTLLAVAFFAQMIPVAAKNFIGDRRLETCCKPDFALLKQDTKIFILAGGICAVALVVVFFNVIVSPFNLDRDTFNNARILFGVGSCVVLLGCSFLCLPHRIARINVYLWLCRVMSLVFSYQLQQWFTAPAKLCPDGPHFPTTIYQSIGYVTASVATLFGIWIFEKFVVHWYAPRAFWLTTLFTCVGALFDICLVTGFNRYLLSWTGLGEVLWTPEGKDPVRMDDVALFLFGTQALRSIVDVMDFMPAALLLSKICPKGLEATVFAVLVAFFNLGLSMSGQMGSRFLALTGFNIAPVQKIGLVDEPCNMGQGPFGMNGLVFGLVVGDIVLPLLTIPLTWVFIPPIRLDEDFVAEVDRARGGGGGGVAAVTVLGSPARGVAEGASAATDLRALDPADITFHVGEDDAEKAAPVRRERSDMDSVQGAGFLCCMVSWGGSPSGRLRTHVA